MTKQDPLTMQSLLAQARPSSSLQLLLKLFPSWDSGSSTLCFQFSVSSISSISPTCTVPYIITAPGDNPQIPVLSNYCHTLRCNVSCFGLVSEITKIRPPTAETSSPTYKNIYFSTLNAVILEQPAQSLLSYLIPITKLPSWGQGQEGVLNWETGFTSKEISNSGEFGKRSW